MSSSQEILTASRLAWLDSSLATIGGALGAVVESDLAVREAVYGNRTDRRDSSS